jgi:protein involved in polysaccharide export with SLBB domain
MRPLATLAVLGALAGVRPLAAQQVPGGEPVSGYMSREDLNGLIARMEGALHSPAYSEPLKERARAQEAEARARLEQGDFQVGDRILLVVQGESALSDTFTVQQGHQLVLPVVGALSLTGVLHGELTSYLTSQLAHQLRQPRVQAHAMVRVAIEGAVMRPGFYSVPVGALLGDALMAAGGLAPTAQAAAARVERSGRDVLSAAAFRHAMTAGQTLDQLDVRAGDRITIPLRGVGLGAAEGPIRTISLLLSLPLTAFAVSRLF